MGRPGSVARLLHFLLSQIFLILALSIDMRARILHFWSAFNILPCLIFIEVSYFIMQKSGENLLPFSIRTKMHNFPEIGRFFIKSTRNWHTFELRYQLILLNKFQIIFYAFETLILAIVYLSGYSLRTFQYLNNLIAIFDLNCLNVSLSCILWWWWHTVQSFLFRPNFPTPEKFKQSLSFPSTLPFFIQACQPPFQGNNVLEWREIGGEFECSVWLGCGFTFLHHTFLRHIALVSPPTLTCAMIISTISIQQYCIQFIRFGYQFFFLNHLFIFIAFI